MAETSVKRCTDCDTEKPLSMFNTTGQCGRYRPQCKPCMKIRDASQIEARRLNDGPIPEFRICSKCNEKKPLTGEFFKKRSQSTYGLTPECKCCLSKRNLEWSKTEKGSEVKKKSSKKCSERQNEKNKEYAKQNRSRLNAYMRDWRSINIEKVRKSNRDSAKRRAHKRAAYRHMRRAAGKFSYDVIPELMKLQKGLCACCRKPFSSLVEVDHITPIALGGTNERSNLQLLCRFCNRSKGAKHPIDFMQSIGYLL